MAFPRLEVSEGGGFTGAVSTYSVLTNGQVFHSNSFSGGFTVYGKVGKKDAVNWIKEVKKSIAIPTPVKEPDNIYRVFKVIEKDTTYEAVWYEKRSGLDSIYNKIISKIESENAKYE